MPTMFPAAKMRAPAAWPALMRSRAFSTGSSAFQVSNTVVQPPRREICAASSMTSCRRPSKRARYSAPPLPIIMMASSRCTLPFMMPGRTNCPVTSSTVAPGGSGISARRPTARKRPPSIRTTASGSGSPPLPSIKVPPMTASSSPVPVGLDMCSSPAWLAVRPMPAMQRMARTALPATCWNRPRGRGQYPIGYFYGRAGRCGQLSCGASPSAPQSTSSRPQDAAMPTDWAIVRAPSLAIARFR